MIDHDKQIVPVWWLFYWQCKWVADNTPVEKKPYPVFRTKSKRSIVDEWELEDEVVMCYLLGLTMGLKSHNLPWKRDAQVAKIHQRFLDSSEDVTLENLHEVAYVVSNQTELQYSLLEIFALKYGREIYFGYCGEYEIPYVLTEEMYVGLFWGFLQFKDESLVANNIEFNLALLNKNSKGFFNTLEKERILDIIYELETIPFVRELKNMVLDAYGWTTNNESEEDPFDDMETNHFRNANK